MRRDELQPGVRVRSKHAAQRRTVVALNAHPDGEVYDILRNDGARVVTGKYGGIRVADMLEHWEVDR